MSLRAPVAHAIVISVAEVRGDTAFVRGSDAGRKQEISWEGDTVTTANGKGNFSFEGVLPDPCDEDSCIGTLTAGGDPIPVPLTFASSEPPFEPVDELVLKAEQPFSHQGDAVRAVGFVANGEGGTLVVSGGADARLLYWHLDLSEYLDLDLPNIPYDLDVWTGTTGSSSIVATGEGGWNGNADADTLRIWDSSGLPLIATQAPIGYVYSVAFSPVAGYTNNYWVAASGFYGDIVLYHLINYTGASSTEMELYSITATKKKRTKALEFFPGGNLIASASTGGIQLRSIPEKCAPDNCELDLRLTLSHSGSWSFSIAAAPVAVGKTELVSATDSGTIKIWTIENLDTSPMASVRSVDSPSVYSVDWSPNGEMIVAGGNGDITVYDLDLNILFRNENAHAGRVNDVSFSPDSSRVVSGGADGYLKVWVLQ